MRPGLAGSGRFFVFGGVWRAAATGCPYNGGRPQRPGFPGFRISARRARSNHMAEALYRKYRPQIFEDVVGQ